MVSFRRRDRRGASNIGCLVSLLLFVVALYYGAHIGEVYWRYYQLLDTMRSQARVAPSLTDATIRRRILAKVEELQLPEEARRIVIKRSARPRVITIQTEYRERVELPFFTHEFVLRPRAEQPL